VKKDLKSCNTSKNIYTLKMKTFDFEPNQILAIIILIHCWPTKITRFLAPIGPVPMLILFDRDSPLCSSYSIGIGPNEVRNL